MGTSEEQLFLLLQKKIQELEAEHANLQHEFYNWILDNDHGDVSLRKPKMPDLTLDQNKDGRRRKERLGLDSSDTQCLNILQSTGQSIHMFDSNGLVIYWNRSAEKLYGYSTSEVLGQHILDIFVDAKEAREDAIDILQRNVAGEKWTGSFPVKNKHGKRFVVFVTNTPLYDDYGSIVGFVCVSFDVQSFLQLPPLPSSEAYASISPSASGPMSKPGQDSQQPLEVVVTASGACTLRGEVPPSPFGVSYKPIHRYKYPATFSEDSGGESKIEIRDIITSKIEARNAHGIFTWTEIEQEDDIVQPKSPDSYEKPEMQLLRSNRFGNEASGLRSSSKATNCSVSSSIKTGSGPLCKFDKETDSLHYDILWEELTIFERIGQGSCGNVYRGLWCGSNVALKVFSKCEYSDDLLHSFRQEVLLMKTLRHPNVLLFMGAVTLPEHLCIVTEFLPRGEPLSCNGSLFQLLQRSTSKLDRRRRVLMALDIARGMNYLHNCDPPVVHRDLKSSNLLIDKNWTVKVADFGLSKLKHATYLTTKTGKGTPQWMAPEVIRNDPSDEKSDVYSFGVILWELATQKIPWDTLNPMQVIGAVGFMDQRIEIPKDTDPQWASLIESCWHSEPKCRPSFQDLLEKLKDVQKRFLSKTKQPT